MVHRVRGTQPTALLKRCDLMRACNTKQAEKANLMHSPSSKAFPAQTLDVYFGGARIKENCQLCIEYNHRLKAT